MLFFMQVSDLVAKWGSQEKAARALQCSQSAVAKWVKRNSGAVPWPYQCVAHYVSGGELKPKKDLVYLDNNTDDNGFVPK